MSGALPAGYARRARYGLLPETAGVWPAPLKTRHARPADRFSTSSKLLSLDLSLSRRHVSGQGVQMVGVQTSRIPESTIYSPLRH